MELALVCALIALGYSSILNDKIAFSVALAVDVAVSIQDGRLKRRYERNLLDWQIENARRRVAEFEAEVRGPQEYFDDAARFPAS